MGDLPNIEVTASGSGSLEQKISAPTLTKGENALLDADGAAAVLHAGPDDYQTNPSGESGARIAGGDVPLSKSSEEIKRLPCGTSQAGAAKRHFHDRPLPDLVKPTSFSTYSHSRRR